jgi:hypothetical protein
MIRFKTIEITANPTIIPLLEILYDPEELRIQKIIPQKTRIKFAKFK